MTNLVARILEMLIRVRQFGLTHESSFPEGSRGRELFDLAGGFIDALEAQSATHEQHARGAKEKTTLKKSAVAELRELMASISRTARGMARNSPGLADKFRMPPERGVQELLTVARSFQTEATPFKDEFIRRGMPPAFIEMLRERIMLLEQTVDEQAQKASARISASVTATDTARSARGAVRELDDIVRNVYAEDAAALAEWESASHIERAPHRAEEEEASPAQPAPAQA